MEKRVRYQATIKVEGNAPTAFIQGVWDYYAIDLDSAWNIARDLANEFDGAIVESVIEWLPSADG